MKKIVLFICVLCFVGCKQEKKESTIDTSQRIKDSIVNELKKPIEEPKIDSAKVKELKTYFNFKKDEFENHTWVEPKDSPKHVDVNGIYCYFALNSAIASNLRLKIQYAADDWLFIQSYKFSIDGMTYDYTPGNIERDNDSSIWEWSDNQLNMYDQSLINALLMAKKAKIRFVGRQYNKDKTITQQQLLSIKRTVQLYKAMGGSIQ